MQKGLFIVLDGNDGSGKATQTKQLGQYLEQQGIEYIKVDFPAYGENFFGREAWGFSAYGSEDRLDFVCA
jgi:thymidylate kinase